MVRLYFYQIVKLRKKTLTTIMVSVNLVFFYMWAPRVVVMPPVACVPCVPRAPALCAVAHGEASQSAESSGGGVDVAHHFVDTRKLCGADVGQNAAVALQGGENLVAQVHFSVHHCCVHSGVLLCFVCSYDAKVDGRCAKIWHIKHK